MSAAAFRQLLEEGDVTALVDTWAQLRPGMPRPETRDQAEIILHLARTATESVGLKYRAWSHRWLTERDLPSQLPDHLRPLAERMYPAIAEGVGISVRLGDNPLLKPAAAEIQSAMSDAVEDCYAESRTDVSFVRARMGEAKDRTMRALFGKT